MDNLFFSENFVFSRQPLDNINIQSVFHDKTALPRRLRVFSFFVHRINNRKIIAAASLIVILTESRRRMNNARTVFNGDIVGAGYEERLLIRLYKRHQLFVFHILQLFSFHLLQDLIVFRSQHFVR